MKAVRREYPDGRMYWEVEIGPLLLWQYDLSVSWRDKTEANVHNGLFSLRCGLCRAWSWGCDEHWFCGICQPCKDRDDDDE